LAVSAPERCDYASDLFVHFWADMSQSKGPIVAEPLLSSRADAIIAADRAGIIRVWTPGAERLSGLDQAPRSH
jgi:hypothetical protein